MMQPQRRSEPGRSALQRRGVLPRPTDFLAPERLRADLRLALRGILGLMVPVLLGRALDLPAFDMVGIAAFLLTFGDVTGSEEPRQIIRLAVATVLGATALASGVIAGSHALGATAGMFVWSAAAGLLGAYGNAGAAMGLPVAWSYLELGLTAPVHTLSHAFALAALYAGGGLWAVILASVINAIGPYGPGRERTAQRYAVLAKCCLARLACPICPRSIRRGADRSGPQYPCCHRRSSQGGRRAPRPTARRRSRPRALRRRERTARPDRRRRADGSPACHRRGGRPGGRGRAEPARSLVSAGAAADRKSTRLNS